MRPKRLQRGLRVITLQGARKKSPILISEYWKNEGLDGTIIISYFGGSNNIFCRLSNIYVCVTVGVIIIMHNYHLSYDIVGAIILIHPKC